VHTDHLNTPRKIAQPSTGTLAWRYDSDPFGTVAPNQNPGGLGTFTYNLRFPGQYYQAETGLNQNWNRDYDPLIGKYDQSDPAGLAAGVNTYAYVGSNPLLFFDPDGLGKEGGQTSVGGNDPLMPKSINQNSSQEAINEAIAKAEAGLKQPGMNPKRASKVRAWIKVAKRGFKSACPPFLEELALETAYQLCVAGDQNMCQVYLMLGGEVGVPGA
jgi:RHS repeat-associated protein